MKNRNVIKQDYHLVNAKYKLNTSEIKFILSVLSQIDTDDAELKEYEIKVSDLETRLQSKQNETHLKQFAKKILSKPLEVPTNDGWIVFNWFEHIEYVRGHSKFKVSISKKLKPYLLELKERFVKYNLSYILPLTSNYSIRIYQLLKEYEKLTRRTFTVLELQELLQVPKSLMVYADFKRKVLQIAEKELIENCDIFFEFEEIKQGRKITELLFRIKPNKSISPTVQPSLFTPETSQFHEYIGKSLNTPHGVKVIKLITPFDDFLKVDFHDDTYAQINLITLLSLLR